MEDATGLATDGAAKDDPYKDMRDAKPYLDAIADAERCFRTWQEKSDSIDKLFADLKKLSGETAERQMQIFWANLEVLKPTIYARPPVPVVSARFKDRKPLVRHSSEVLERCLITSFDGEDINQTMLLLRDDLATNGRGASWVRYERDETGERVAYDHVDRKDFCHEPARKWKEVGWAARQTHETMDSMRGRFEATSGNAYLKAEYVERKDEQDYKGEKKAAVWEVWDRRKGVTVWVTKGVEEVLDIGPPELRLANFFPCPRPAYGTLERGTLKPVPDFLYYKDQVEEINEMTARISALAESLRLKGFYAGGAEDISGAIEAAIRQNDNSAILIPVPNFAAMGGAKLSEAIVWLPVDQVAKVITDLVALRKQLIDDVYQLTGLSDIMRGSSDPNETLGAQELKSQYGSVRIRDRQEELVRIARDMCRIAGEIMAENFSPETLAAMSQYDEVPTQASVEQQVQAIQQQIAQAARNPQIVAQAQANPQQAQQLLQQAKAQVQQLQGQITFEQVVSFLRDQRMRPFVLEIETDSTIQPDENAAKQRTTEFLTALSTALSQLAPMVQTQPQSAEFAGEVLKFAVTPFRAGRNLDAAIDNFVDQIKQTASQPQPDPEAEKVKMEMEAEKAKNEQDMTMAREKHDMEMQEMRAELAFLYEKLGIDRQNMAMKAQAQRESAVMKAKEAA